MVKETGNRNRILEMRKFLIWFDSVLHPQFFTDFHQILQAAQECRRIDAYL